MERKNDELRVLLTPTEADEACAGLCVALDNVEFMALPDTNRKAILSVMRKIFTARPATDLR